MTNKYFVLLALLLFSIAGPLTFERTEAATSSPARNPENRDVVVTETLPSLPIALADEAAVLVAWKSRYRMGLYERGKLVKSYVIGLGQSPLGHKESQGDNRTPEGEYRIIQKSRGPFNGGPYSQYLGVAWLRINYPNEADAINGFRKGLITKGQKDAIIKANQTGKEPPKSTRLGGGIGVHGWRGNWPGEDRQNLTWGCISMQNPQLDDLYRQVGVGTRVVIYP